MFICPSYYVLIPFTRLIVNDNIGYRYTATELSIDNNSFGRVTVSNDSTLTTVNNITDSEDFIYVIHHELCHAIKKNN